eukprot:scaffold489_cov309-Pavlova_lutheri.AAC.14
MAADAAEATACQGTPLVHVRTEMAAKTSVATVLPVRPIPRNLAATPEVRVREDLPSRQSLLPCETEQFHGFHGFPRVHRLLRRTMQRRPRARPHRRSRPPLSFAPPHRWKRSSLESGKLDRKVLRSKGKRNRWEPDRRSNDAMDEAIASAEAAANAADASKAASACQEAEMRVGGRKEAIEKELEKGSR